MADITVLAYCIIYASYYYSHYYTDDVDAITVMVGDTNGRVKVYMCLGWEQCCWMNILQKNKAMFCEISISLTII